MSKDKIEVRLGARDIAQEALAEVDRQLEKWGVQNHPSIVAVSAGEICERYGIPTANDAKLICEDAAQIGGLTYADILIEELAEALEAAEDFGEGSDEHRTELIQCTAVLLSWISSLDRRHR